MADPVVEGALARAEALVAALDRAHPEAWDGPVRELRTQVFQTVGYLLALARADATEWEARKTALRARAR